MTPRERLLTTIRGGRSDRVPMVLEHFHCADPADFRDPLQREIAERVWDQIHCAVGVPTGLNRYLAVGVDNVREVSRTQRDGNVEIVSEIVTPKGTLTDVVSTNSLTETPWTVKHPVESLADIEAIRSCPWDVPSPAAPPDMSNLPDCFAERGITWLMISSPMVCVAAMMPREMFLELCVTDLPLLTELTAIACERSLAVMEVTLADENVDYLWMGGCEWVTPPLAAPAVYEQLVQPFEKAIIDRAHAAGAIAHVHCHGNIRSTLERVIERGGDFLEPCEPPPDGDMTFAEMKSVAAGRITLGGNVEGRVLDMEDVDTVEVACRASFEGGKDRMVFQTSAGPYSRVTPRQLENYHRLIDVWEELSPID
jgi:hypothetical protein